MAQFSDLPFEIVILILQATRTHDHPANLSVWYTLCLVRKDWCLICQEMMFETLIIGYETYGYELLMSPALGRWETHNLTLRGLGDEGWPIALEILEKVRGVKRLNLQQFGEDDELDVEDLNLPSLQNLTWLSIEGCWINHKSETKIGFPFQLEYLDQHHTYIDSKTPVSIFASSALRTLRITAPDFSDDGDDDVVNVLTTFGPQLHHFEWNADFFAKLAPLFANFRQLKRLTLPCKGNELQSILRHLPSHLNYLGLPLIQSRKRVKDNLPIINDFSCVQHLRELHLEDAYRSTIMKDEDCAKILELFTKRGVTVKFGDEVPGAW